MVRFGRDDALSALVSLRSMTDCTLVTCELIPGLDPDDRLLVDELRKRGLTVTSAVWSDPRVDWAQSRLSVLRSTWDYHGRYADFARWIDRVSDVTALRNDAAMVRWNMHKSYLRDLESQGVPVVPTAWVYKGRPRSLADLRTANGWGDCVIKPARGLATHGVLLVRCDGPSSKEGQAHLDGLVRDDDVLVQPYLGDVVSYGERALIFLLGRFSHAVVKKPFDTVLAVGDAGGAAVEVTQEEVAVAAKALGAAPGRPLYARVDLLRDDEGAARVSEVELIEPALYFGASTDALQSFADCIELELAALGRRLTIYG